MDGVKACETDTLKVALNDLLDGEIVGAPGGVRSKVYVADAAGDALPNESHETTAIDVVRANIWILPPALREVPVEQVGVVALALKAVV